MADESKKLSRWYFGGVSSAAAACVTHPLDLLKVHLQTQQEGKISIVRSTVEIIRKQGILALYNGLSASLLRQLTYSTIRFSVYDISKRAFETPDCPVPFYQKFLLAGISGAIGGVIGTPSDVITVRMQNDIKLAPELRRNYKHVFDGLFRVIQQEGVRQLFSGCSTGTMRAVLMTIGQLSFYDQIKTMLLQTGYFRDIPSTHILSSVFARFIRLAPQTILTFVFLEQLRYNFGFYPQLHMPILSCIL